MLSSQRQAVKYQESQVKLKQAKEALLNFAVVNGYLPCADGNGDGQEDRHSTNNTCTTRVGHLPFKDLGLSLKDIEDGFHSKIHYAINTDTSDSAKICDPSEAASYFCNQSSAPVFERTTPPTAGTAGSGNYTVCDDQATCSPPANIALAEASVILVAFNKNGYDQINNCNSVSGAKERENCDTDAFYVQGSYAEDAANFFDDKVLGITGYEIKNKMLSAGVGL